MADPHGDIGAGDWLAALISVVLSCMAGIGSARLWFKADKEAIYGRIEQLEKVMRDYETIRSGQATQLAVLQACQATIQSRLQEIKDDIQDSAMRGAHSVNTQLATVLTEMQKMTEHMRRRP